jgi:hypothetical protein
MRYPRRIGCLVLAGALVCGCSDRSGGPKTGALPLRTVTDLPLQGDTSRFDYASLDATRHRLYISHLGASQVVVVDTDGPTVERTLDKVAGVHGVLVVPALNHVYAAATGSDQAVTYDATTLAELNRGPTGRAPDGLAYDPDTDAVYLSNEAGSTVTEIDATSGASRREIDIGGEAGNVAYDPTTKHVLVDVQTRNELAVIDPAHGRVVERHPLPGCDHDHGLQLDIAHPRAFVACDGNARLLQVDLTTFAVTAAFATGARPDVLTLDAGLGRLYVLAESGVATILDTSDDDVRVLARGVLAPGAHSGTVDPATHTLYVPIANQAGRPLLRVLTPDP